MKALTLIIFSLFFISISAQSQSITCKDNTNLETNTTTTSTNPNYIVDETFEKLTVVFQKFGNARYIIVDIFLPYSFTILKGDSLTLTFTDGTTMNLGYTSNESSQDYENSNLVLTTVLLPVNKFNLLTKKTVKKIKVKLIDSFKQYTVEQSSAYKIKLQAKCIR